MPADLPPDLWRWSARDLATALRTRRVSAREALAAHHERIDAVNPQVNAVVIEDREGARARAAAADELAATTPPEQLPPLHGLPMTHKDTHLVAGIRSTMGSALTDVVPTSDDLIIARLRAAGANSTGKNNVPEFAAGSHTFNELFGATGNPYAPHLSCGGSSGGAAVVLATGIQALADGSDLGGSLRNPAAFCNVVGYRPSAGIVPVAPTKDAWAWLTISGPMAREVADIALAMSVLAGPDPRVALPCPVDAQAFAPLITATPDPDARPLHGLRVGFTVDFGLGMPVQEPVAQVVIAAREVFDRLGAQVSDACPNLRTADEVFDTYRALAMALSLRELVARYPEEVKPEVGWNVERGVELTGTDLMNATAARTRLRAQVARWFSRFDVLLAPTAQVLPFDLTQRYPEQIAGQPMSSYVDWMRSCSIVSAMGSPAISVPAGFAPADPTATGSGTPELPVGLQIIGAHGDDVRVLAVAQAFEAATRHVDRRPHL
ncbi:amidase [Kineosphaera limosa]|uniref:Putative amidase n=1 Tax=Kineosphaera limosa NBRC 100340 TaxID=1184609 RepID=K6XDV0_9MICO|nr:amidase family protein [Kineosphaera limosa]NYE00376.1 amidase [Kineosphaera limosa]GAB97014.1 putative amidase [Kineosphaera limosa NBRC 100340]